ncbi:MAG: hypothetical protein ACH350_03340 [Parachlamydiaceae bacterium]
MTIEESTNTEKSETIFLNQPMLHKRIQTAEGWKRGVGKKRKLSKTIKQELKL